MASPLALQMLESGLQTCTAYLFVLFCAAIEALFLHTKAARHSTTRWTFTLCLVSVMLVTTPFLYQKSALAITLSAATAAIALSILDICFLHPDDPAPTYEGLPWPLSPMAGLLLTITNHNMWGVRAGHQKMLAAEQAAAAGKHKKTDAEDDGAGRSSGPAARPSQATTSTDAEEPQDMPWWQQPLVSLGLNFAAWDAACTLLGYLLRAYPIGTSLSQLPPGIKVATSTAAGVILVTQFALTYAQVRRIFTAVGAKSALAAMPPTLFNAVWAPTSLSQLWGRKWHQLLRWYFQGLGYKLAEVTTKPFIAAAKLPLSAQQALLPAARLLAAFALSGAMHEYMTWAAFGIMDGRQMAFFMLHGVGVMAESLLRKAAPGFVRSIPAPISWLLTLGFVACSSPLFMHAYIEGGYFSRMLHPMAVPCGTLVLAKAGGLVPASI